MLEFILNTLPYMDGQSDPDDGNARTVEQFRAGQISAREGIAQLHFTGWKTLKWMGSFDELKTSDDEYAHEVRRAFFEIEDEDEIPAAVGPDQETTFRKHLKSWGC